MPRGPCNPDSEDLQGLEVPQSFSSAEEEPDSGSSMVSPICGEHLFVTVLKTQSDILVWALVSFKGLLNKSFPLFHQTATKEVQEDQERYNCGSVLCQRVAGMEILIFFHNNFHL